MFLLIYSHRLTHFTLRRTPHDVVTGGAETRTDAFPGAMALPYVASRGIMLDSRLRFRGWNGFDAAVR